ncbi:hypothetical protein [Bacillus thuringiensis]|uniref:hypothetical protein n=1 Tax=Bacillus thuringiensis TaxID=1428 RepID=UPI001298D2AD|nr:hypothetical protein [Bacillus thuringiensis]MDA2497752.1 hypothetical protein [Bacillus cereus]MRC32273.1 hypothetical protein [Bacillus thuringiensis]HDR8043325.1 hypothetical protein [Bacillus cereus]
MKKMLSSLLLSLVMLFGFSISTSAATYDYGSYWFTTNDGNWDGTFPVKTYGNKVTLELSDLGTVPEGRILRIGDIQARLCSASTGSCTGYKRFSEHGDGVTHFYWTNMVPGTYRVDIIEPYSYKIAGYSYISVNEDA